MSEALADTSIDPHGPDDAQVVNPALVAASQPEVKPEFKLTDDQNQVTYGDKTYVRAEALRQEREQNQQLRKTVDQLAPLMPEFERFLQSRQQANNATVDRATRQAPQGDYTEDELTGYALTRGYYDGQNQPDLKRAAADLDIMTAIADRRAGRATQPLAEQTARDRAAANASRVMAQQFVDGQPIADPQYLKATFDALPDNVKADPNVANIAAVIAVGLQTLDDRRTGMTRTARREPAFREGSGGSFARSGGELDALGRAAARARGKTPEQWSKMTNSVGGTAFGGDVLEEV